MVFGFMQLWKYQRLIQFLTLQQSTCRVSNTIFMPQWASMFLCFSAVWLLIVLHICKLDIILWIGLNLSHSIYRLRIYCTDITYQNYPYKITFNLTSLSLCLAHQLSIQFNFVPFATKHKITSSHGLYSQ